VKLTILIIHVNDDVSNLSISNNDLIKYVNIMLKVSSIFMNNFRDTDMVFFLLPGEIFYLEG